MKEKLSVSARGIEYEYRYDAPTSKACVNSSDEFEIVYVLQGSGKYVVENREYDLSPRTAFFTLPSEFHGMLQDSPSNVERFRVRFSRGSVSDDALDMLLLRFDERADRAISSNSSELSLILASAFERFEIADSLDDKAKGVYLRALLEEIAVLLSSSVPKPISTKEDELGEKVLRYLNGNINKNISLDKLAGRFFVSKYYLCRAFKQRTGVSVHNYINYKRIMHAKELIESGETASRAADSVGFGDYSAFYRAYVRILGKAPGSNKRERR